MSYVPVRYMKDYKYDYINNKYINTNQINFIGFKQIERLQIPYYYIVFQIDQDIYDLVDEGHQELLLFKSIKLAKQYLIEQNILKEQNDK